MDCGAKPKVGNGGASSVARHRVNVAIVRDSSLIREIPGLRRCYRFQ